MLYDSGEVPIAERNGVNAIPEFLTLVLDDYRVPATRCWLSACFGVFADAGAIAHRCHCSISSS
jgi:hypothetical protein